MLWRQVLSESPTAESEYSQASDPNSPFRRHLREVNLAISSSGTLSGHERNCVFLNTGTSRFATISAVTGFDFDDDTRAVATVDWDGDGDLDVWTTNRTSPRVRVLRNDHPETNHFVAVKLMGTTCNRDAIGARVEVFLEADPTEKGRLVKTLRAGEGFLTQCSKWLHFGLGKNDRIRGIAVDWPSGEREFFSGLTVDSRYRCVQGTGKATAIARRRPIALKSTRVADNKLPPSRGARIPLTATIPAPALRYRDSTGQTRNIDADTPTLIILWASQCGTCREELSSLVAHDRHIREQNLHVVALSVDSLLDSAATSGSAESFLESIRFPFDSGVAMRESIERLRTMYEMPFAVPSELATPTSFLLDGNARLAVIYHGELPTRDLIRDVEQVGVTDSEWTQYAQPFAGRWNTKPVQTFNLLRIAVGLVDRGHLNDAIAYLARNQETITKEPEFAKLAVWIGDQLIADKRTSEALAHYQMALASDPTDVTVMNNIAWQFATHRDEGIRDGKQAVRWAEEAARQTKYSNPGVLDTLAASYAASNQFPKAVKVLERALFIVRKQRQDQLVQRYSDRLKLYQSGQVLLQDP